MIFVSNTTQNTIFTHKKATITSHILSKSSHDHGVKKEKKKWSKYKIRTTKSVSVSVDCPDCLKGLFPLCFTGLMNQYLTTWDCKFLANPDQKLEFLPKPGRKHSFGQHLTFCCRPTRMMTGCNAQGPTMAQLVQQRMIGSTISTNDGNRP